MTGDSKRFYGVNKLTYSRESGQDAESLGPDFSNPKDVIIFVDSLSLPHILDIEVCEFSEDGDIHTIYDFEDFQQIFDI